MAQLTFYRWLYLATDLLYIVPILIAYTKFKKLSIGQKWFVGYLLVYFSINIISDIMVFCFNTKNLFLWYFYSLADLVFTFQTYRYFFQNQLKIKYLIILFSIGLGSLLLDLFWLTGFANEENYFSESVISLCIFVVSLYYLVNLLSKNIKENVFNELNLFIALCLMVQFFLKAVLKFLSKYLFETESNYYTIVQYVNFFNFFNIITLLIVSWAFHNLFTSTGSFNE